MTSDEMQELLFSLAWASWSSYHYNYAKKFLENYFPGADWDKVLEDFTKVILSSPQEGSPK